MQQLPLLRNADLILYTSGNISTADMEPLRFRNFFVKHAKNPGYQQGAIQAVVDGFGPKGHQEKWFDGYDWVVRLNPDVLILQDEWLHETMLNSSVDGIFGECKGGQIHTDFLPSAHKLWITQGWTCVSGGQRLRCTFTVWSTRFSSPDDTPWWPAPT